MKLIFFKGVVQWVLTNTYSCEVTTIIKIGHISPQWAPLWTWCISWLWFWVLIAWVYSHVRIPWATHLHVCIFLSKCLTSIFKKRLAQRMAIGYKVAGWVAKGMGEEQRGRHLEQCNAETYEKRGQKTSLWFYLTFSFLHLLLVSGVNQPLSSQNWISAFLLSSPVITGEITQE